VCSNHNILGRVCCGVHYTSTLVITSAIWRNSRISSIWQTSVRRFFFFFLQTCDSFRHLNFRWIFNYKSCKGERKATEKWSYQWKIEFILASTSRAKIQISSFPLHGHAKFPVMSAQTTIRSWRTGLTLSSDILSQNRYIRLLTHVYALYPDRSRDTCFSQLAVN